MGARELLTALVQAGFEVEATADRLLIRPASKLTDDQREALREFKPELMVLLRGDLTAAINAACAARGDDDANRLALIAEGTALPTDTQADLIEHFRAVVADFGGAP